MGARDGPDGNAVGTTLYTTRTSNRLYWATYNFPTLSIITQSGLLIMAEVAGPSSPGSNPAEVDKPFPA